MERGWRRGGGAAPGGRPVALLLVATLLACGGDASRLPGRDAGSANPAGDASAAAPQGTQSTGTDGAGATPGPGAPAAVDNVPRVVLLGTSLTAGLGLPPEEAYPALLQRKADSAGFRVAIVNAGLSGETSAGALRRVAWVLEQPAALVVLEVGANDGLRGVQPDSTRENLVALIRAVRELRPEARIALVQMEAPTNLGREYTAAFRAAYPVAAQRTGVPLLPFLLEGVAGVAALNQADGIHPNAAGARRVADTMWRALLPLLRELPGAAPSS